MHSVYMNIPMLMTLEGNPSPILFPADKAVLRLDEDVQMSCGTLTV